MTRSKSAKRVAACKFSLGAVALAVATQVAAVDIDTGNADLSIRWDNTVKGTMLYRLKEADAVLVNSFGPGMPQAIELNAGNDNFRNQGFFSKRVDLLSEIDVVYRNDFGLRLSGAGWYDYAYRGTTDAQDMMNGQRVYNQFDSETRHIAGRKAELLDAFVFGGWELGNGQRISARLGRHALQWGESLFYGDNGIARAQGPIDVMKLQSSPNAQFKEVIRPVPQASLQWQLSPTMSFGGYYQFDFESDRMAPGGSYFSTANAIWGGSGFASHISMPAEAGPLAGNYMLAPAGDKNARPSGQFGLQFKWRVDETDFGAYVARYHDKSGQPIYRLNLADQQSGEWYYLFPEAVKTIGVSASRSIGVANFAIEASLRDDQPLVNRVAIGVLGAPEQQLAIGRTAHVNLSWFATLPPNFLSREINFLGELAWNRVLSSNDPNRLLDTGRTRDSTAMQLLFVPTYRQVVPGLDLNVPVGLRYVLDGHSSVTGLSWGGKGTGTFSIGIEGDYEGTWQFGLTYNKFIGKSTPFLNYETLEYGRGNPLGDRDYVAFNLRRTF